MPERHQSRLIITLLIGFLPVYLITLIAKLGDNNGFTVGDILGKQMLFSAIGLLLIIILFRYLLKRPLSLLSQRPAGFMQDITAAFLILISLYTLITLARITWLPLLPPQTPPAPQTITSIQWIAQRPFYTWLLMIPILMTAQTYLETCRALFLTALDPGSSPALSWTVIFLSAICFALINIGSGMTTLLLEFQSALVMAIAYHYTRRLLPLILASYLFQSMGFIDFLLQ